MGRQGRFVLVVMSSLVMKTVVLAVISVIEVKGNRWSGSRSKIGISHVYRIGNKNKAEKMNCGNSAFWGYIPNQYPIDAKERDGIFKTSSENCKGMANYGLLALSKGLVLPVLIGGSLVPPATR